ncbi:MAG: hypothetical protein P8K76_12565 [Candidatus Binatia bacterium]|nr:hypothetical protein [Candidatus Binatia bacterium]
MASTEPSHDPAPQDEVGSNTGYVGEHSNAPTQPMTFPIALMPLASGLLILLIGLLIFLIAKMNANQKKVLETLYRRSTLRVEGDVKGVEISGLAEVLNEQNEQYKLFEIQLREWNQELGTMKKHLGGQVEQARQDQENFVSDQLGPTKNQINDALNKIAETFKRSSQKIQDIAERLEGFEELQRRTSGELARHRDGYDAHRIRQFYTDLFRLRDDSEAVQRDAIDILLQNHGIETIPTEALEGEDWAKWSSRESREPTEQHHKGKVVILRDGFRTRTGDKTEAGDELFKVLRMAEMIRYTSADATDPSESQTTGTALSDSATSEQQEEKNG